MNTAKTTAIEQATQLRRQRHGRKRGRPDRSFLRLSDLTPQQLEQRINQALAIKLLPSLYQGSLDGRTVALLFQKTSTRTRTSFEVGAQELGAKAVYLDWAKTNFSKGALQDETRVLSRYADLIAARVFKHGDLEIMKSASEVPIVNALSDLQHPTQVLADLMTVKEYFGTFAGLKLAFVGDGNNVCNSLLEGAMLTGMKIDVAVPPGYEPAPELVEQATTGGLLTLGNDPKEAVQDADVIYTDAWVSIGQEAEEVARRQAFQCFSVTQELLAAAPSHALVMHCLPAYRDLEIASDVLDSERCIVFEQAENKKHAKKALMLWLLSESPTVKATPSSPDERYLQGLGLCG